MPNGSSIPAPNPPLGIGSSLARRARTQAGESLRAAFWGTLVFIALYFAAALACLWQWGSPRPWSRVDIFSGGFLLISLMWIYATMQFHRAIFRSREVMREASGMTFDPEMLTWINVFAVAELSVFADYGHWHLVPQLEKPVLQTIGLVMYFLGAVWLIWTDRHLSRQFQGNLSNRKVLNDGPYRFVRHPRYAALIASRIAFSLALASILAWGFALGWLWVNLRRVRLEEAHLHSLFGAEYEAYAARTARFLPGIY
jgi:protein-S-isoprenylcysteine O-methyltransferase Ste14